ncbi:MAG: GNAT family N-acetyltransferase [Terracidiphilus sp.]
MPSPLDNPIWHSLHTEHSHFAVDAGLARRYPAAIGPLSGMADVTPHSLESLHALAEPSGRLALFLEEPLADTPGWTLERAEIMCQMIASGGADSGTDLNLNQPGATPVRPLTAADVPQMLALTGLTNPGPFRERTHELGAFFGIFQGDRLVAMAGQRLHLPRCVEVSAVCTHPDVRGQGYARMLIAAAMREIRQRGKTPFLHVLASNHAAIRVYESLGFTLRCNLHLAVLRNLTPPIRT